MFRRRQPHPRLRRMRELIWPSAGWHRASRYLAHRVRRLPDSPYRIAAGFACGAAVSMTPFLGFHFVLAGLLAWALRGNILASAFGTVLGNPWTLPLIFVWTYRLGKAMMGELGAQVVPEQFSFGYLVDHPQRLLLPMALGSVPTALVVWGIAFGLVYAAVLSYRKARQAKLMHRRSRLPGGAGGEPGE